MADDVTPLASLSLTHVYYNPSDPVSHLCAFLSLLPQALVVVYATLLWSTREAEVLLTFAGQLACEAVNFALKRIIKEERPKLMHQQGARGYGMPSSHAQFAVFWAVAVALFLVVRHRPAMMTTGGRGVEGSKGTKGDGGNKMNKGRDPALADVARAYRSGGLPAASASIEAYSHAPWTVAQRLAVSAAALVIAALVAWSRVYLGYHTVRQVLAGCAAGVVSAVGWFIVTHLLRETGLLAWALQTPVARWFRLRDLVVTEDLCQAGWEKWERRRRELLEKEKKTA
ncbi:putative dolichyldiphosphatase [Madurella mycetomatis]|uniref:Dolichyldiphosphatase n=1 Tax=Madurella mycetomatis TaxID=100816 RepID=A0A175WBF2_9PEZI|nr:putative dolichyldiphosphatase [Madurella mycetomatis]